MANVHTPGPWKLYSEDLRGGKYWCVSFPPSTHDSEIDLHETDNGEANARLIAAAPDLLDACYAAVDRCEYEHIRKILYSAIAKATTP